MDIAGKTPQGKEPKRSFFTHWYARRCQVPGFAGRGNSMRLASRLCCCAGRRATHSAVCYLSSQREFCRGMRHGMRQIGICRELFQSSDREQQGEYSEIYRRALLQVFDQAALRKLYAGPDIQVLVTRTSAQLPRYPGLVIGLSLCAFPALRTRRGFRRLEAQFGFSREFIPVRNCATPAELADLVLASSCTPPFTPWYSLHGRPVLDGGLSESVPLGGLPQRQGKTLVLLTAKATALNRSPGIVYAEPSQDLRISSWDYTDAGKIDYLYALGKKDGSSFLKTTGMRETFING